MGNGASDLQRYFVEWYMPDLTEAKVDHIAATLDESVMSLRAEGETVARLMTVAVPSDDTVFGVFAARSASIAAKVCGRAGLPSQRICEALQDHIAAQTI